MGIYTGQAPRTDPPWWVCPPGIVFRSDWTREQMLEVHCQREARREVECWFTGHVYRWRSLEQALQEIQRQRQSRRSGVPPLVRPHPPADLQPLDFFVSTK